MQAMKTLLHGFQTPVEPFAEAQWGVEYLFSTGWHVKKGVLKAKCFLSKRHDNPKISSLK
jgi:hypothetical protein